MRVFGFNATRKPPLKPPSKPEVRTESACEGSRRKVIHWPGGRLAAVLRKLVEIQGLDHRESEQVALQDRDLGIHVGGSE